MTNDEWLRKINAGLPDEGVPFRVDSYDALHPGRFLKASHLLGEPRTLTIASLQAEVMGHKKGKPDVKGILTFREIKLQYATQKTNHVLLQAMFGADPNALAGKRVTLTPAKDTFGRETVDAIRVAGSPDMTRERIEVRVKYAEKCGRKPSDHVLTRTDVGGDRAQARGNAASKPPGDLTKMLATIESWTGTREDIAAKASEFAWAKTERAEIAKALDARWPAKENE